MKRFLLIIALFLVVFFVAYYVTNGDDLKEMVNIIKASFNENKPESNTEEMYNYLVDKAAKDSDNIDEGTYKLAKNYIYNNIDNCKNASLENLIYYGSLMQHSPKDKYSSSYTLIGIKTLEATKEVYIKDNDYNKKKKCIDKSKAQVIKVLINRINN